MPGTHSPISRHFFTLDGAVRTTGGAKNLAKGEFTIVNHLKAGANGAVVTPFTGEPDSTVYEMRLGKHPIPQTRTAYNSLPYSSNLFTIKDVVEVKANFPKFTEQKFDELIIGYDGINPSTAIDLEENMTVPMDITLTGDHIQFMTGQDKQVIKIHFGKEEGETNQEVVRRAVEVLKSQRLPGSLPITDFIDISVVDSTNPDLVGTAYNYSELSVVDEGDSNALARVQAQYPEYQVVVKNRAGLNTIYGILHPASDTLNAYSINVGGTYIKGCEDCVAGYTEVAGGFVYSITIEDDGIDLSTTVDNIPGYVTGTVVRHGDRDGRGLYTIVTDDKVTDAEIATYVGTAGVQTTATIELIGEVSEVCTLVDTDTIAWTIVDTCYANVQSYNIQLRDNDCGESRLAELQAAYPTLVIEEGQSGGNGSQTITLTGTSGTANVSVGGVNYLATFATSLTVTATNFVTAHAAAILADTGLVVTANAGVLTFAGSTVDLPVSIANVTTNLAGTVSAIDYVTVATAGGCQRVYSTQVITNVVCEECSPIFLEQFTSEAPVDYDFTSWTPVESVPNEDALMGIRLVGKPFDWVPSTEIIDFIPFYETSTRIWVSAGYVEEENESFEPINRNIFNVKRLSRAQDRDSLGYHLRQWEMDSMHYFDGVTAHRKNLLAQGVFGSDTVLKLKSQYVSFHVTIKDNKYSQGVSRSSDGAITYTIWCELGKEANVQAYINKLAARAGLASVNPV